MAAFRRKRSTPGSSRTSIASTGKRGCAVGGNVPVSGKTRPRRAMRPASRIAPRSSSGAFGWATSKAIPLGPAGMGVLATLVDRKSRFTIVVKIKSKKADHVHQKLKGRLKELDDERRRSITFDNGTEFARCYRLEKHLGMELYFADPGCPYQRGTNENTNGLIRQYFPKGTDFRDVSHHEVRQVESRGAAGGKSTQQPPPRMPRISDSR